VPWVFELEHYDFRCLCVKAGRHALAWRLKCSPQLAWLDDPLETENTVAACVE